MAKKHAKILKLEEKVCRLGKVANNLERHGQDWVTGFTIPVFQLMLTKAELNTFMRDKYCHQSWFDTSKGCEPMAWWQGESFYIAESYEADSGTIIVSGNKALEFESTGDPKEDDYKPGIVLSKIVLTPQVGGMTELKCSVYLRPDIGKTNLLLQEHQHREVKLTLAASVSEADKRQPQLPMTDAEQSAAAAETAATH
jgi:hypothetical protein